MSRSRSSHGAPRRIWSGQLELAQGLPGDVEPRGDGGTRFDQARLLVRASGEPVGFVDVELVAGKLTTAAVGRVLAEALGIDASMPPEPPGAIGSTWRNYAGQPVTVAVSTRDRAEQLGRCIESVLASRHTELELLVVDSASRDDCTRRLVREVSLADGRVRYSREELPGLSRARNRALREARTALIAFTDDDTIVDPLWLSAIVRGFRRRPDVACVTGMLASASLERTAEQHYDRRIASASRCDPCIYTVDGPGEAGLHPYAPGSLGIGSNMAFTMDTLLSLGGFDESLGVGTVTGGGEDLDMFVRLLRAGHAISYEPAALVWHEHRQTMRDAWQQTYSYGKGLSAYLAKYLLARESRPELLARSITGAQRAATLAARSGSAIQGAGPLWPLAAAELLGFLAGPPAYLVSRSRVPAAHRRAVAP